MRITALGDSDFLLYGLGDAHSVDRIGRLVGRETDDCSDIVFDSCRKNIVSAYHIGPHCFHREEFAARDLLEGGRMEDVICAGHRRAHAFQTSDIADIEFYLVCNIRVFRLILVAHVVLFLLVA